MGKSTAGRRAAERLDVDFVDLDEVIANRAGKEVKEIFADDGETAFRDCEAAALASTLASTSSALIATGGGIILRPENREQLDSHARVLWLRASTEILLGRVTRNSNRPLLAGSDPTERLTKMVADRYPLYESVADEVLDVDDLTMQQVVMCVVELLR